MVVINSECVFPILKCYQKLLGSILELKIKMLPVLIKPYFVFKYWAMDESTDLLNPRNNSGRDLGSYQIKSKNVFIFLTVQNFFLITP